MQGKECTKADRIIFLEENLKELKTRQIELESKVSEINLKTELQESSINNIEKKVNSLDSKMAKFNILLITNLIAAIFLLVSGLGSLIYFVASGGVK